ncbi:MAG: hypothetical protein WC655_20210 [Candidatus Hydrogenedentales bacterium]
MGWGRYLLLGDFGQQMDLADQKAELDHIRCELQDSRVSTYSASNDTSELRRDINVLQCENDELRMYLTALIRLLLSKGAVSKEELTAIVNAVDSEDGLPDSRYSGPVL